MTTSASAPKPTGPPLSEFAAGRGLTTTTTTAKLAKLVDADCEPPEIDLQFPTIDSRERALPVRQGDLTRLLLAEPGLSNEERQGLARLGALLGANFHSEFYDELL